MNDTSTSLGAERTTAAGDALRALAPANGPAPGNGRGGAAPARSVQVEGSADAAQAAATAVPAAQLPTLNNAGAKLEHAPQGAATSMVSVQSQSAVFHPSLLNNGPSLDGFTSVSLEHTLHPAEPARDEALGRVPAGHLEVGFRDGALGWVGVRATVDADGGVHAALAGVGAAAAGHLTAMLPAVHRFLTENDISVRTLSSASGVSNETASSGAQTSSERQTGSQNAFAHEQGNSSGQQQRRERAETSRAQGQERPPERVSPQVSTQKMSGKDTVSIRI